MSGEPLAEFPHRLEAGQGDQGGAAVRHHEPRQLRRRRQAQVHRGGEAQDQREAVCPPEQEGVKVSQIDFTTQQQQW